MRSHATRIAAPVTLAIVLAVLPLAGCGEKEEPATTGPVVTATTSTTSTTSTNGGGNPVPAGRAPALAVDAFLRSPASQVVCEDLLTQSFLHDEYGSMAKCIASRKPSSLAKGDSKIVQVANHGGPVNHLSATPRTGRYGDKRLQFIVLRQDGSPKSYRIDSVTAKPLGNG